MLWANPYPPSLSYRGVPSDPPMLERIEDFIVRGGECPLDVLAIGPGMWDVGPVAQQDPSLPYSHYEDNFYCGDESFQVFFYKDEQDEEKLAGSR